MEASWWERLTEGETGSCSDGQGHAQQIFNPIFCWRVELCSLPIIYLGPNYSGGIEDNGDAISKMKEWSLFISKANQYHGNPSLFPDQ